MDMGDSVSAMQDLLDVMVRLRDPEAGCPWDKEQDWQSLVPFTLEEAYEVAEAVYQQQPAALKEELGDLLFQVVFYARIAEEQALFSFSDVAATMADKLIKRHPHVFADAEYDSSQAVNVMWEANKARERNKAGHGGALAGVALALPALVRAVKLQKRAARVGFDWPDVVPVMAKVEEELEEVREAMAEGDKSALEHELGDLLMSTSNLARHYGIDPERALDLANRRFESRFQSMEQQAVQPLESMTLEGLDELWEAAKVQEKLVKE